MKTPLSKLLENTICKNCGGWKGLHHYETMKCPRDGKESKGLNPQLWETTTFRAELTYTESKLLEAIENLENDDNSIPNHAWKLIQQAIKEVKGC